MDHSKVEQLASMSDAELSRRLELLGQGSHFTAWRLKTRRAGHPDLVLKRPLPGWRPGPARGTWGSAMERLAGLSGLVPPFSLMVGHGGEDVAPCLLMPFGDQPLAAAAAHWQPLAERLADLRAALAGASLELRDVAQGRCWEGVPFLYDFSDLSIISR